MLSATPARVDSRAWVPPTMCLQGLAAGQPHVRGAALQALDHSPAVNDGTGQGRVWRLWVEDCGCGELPCAVPLAQPRNLRRHRLVLSMHA